MTAEDVAKTSAIGRTREEYAGPASRPAAGGYAQYVKPVLDRVVGFVLFVVSLPILLVSGIAVRLSLGSPVLFRQTRIGRDGREFKVYKLRTMTPDRRNGSIVYEGVERRQTHKTDKDPRITPAGARLRAWRLDELPQFLNVLKGDMSLVGPRPELPQIVANYEDWQHRRHEVKPGVTGLWQVSDHNGSLMHECTEIDIAYVDSISFGQDMVILAKTPLAMFGVRKGY